MLTVLAFQNGTSNNSTRISSAEGVLSIMNRDQ